MVKDDNNTVGACSAASYSLGSESYRTFAKKMSKLLRSCVPIAIAPRISGKAGRTIRPSAIGLLCI